ncbi:sulfotransferase family domain-containing protein [Fusarium sporotrichioides]|uniref:Sulfotransferase family domain-containing protein n=1 Tax=Fusarium sporotrichioides TaxID=5514 RepID=A0A395RHC9_FUSSP|nr:sulfotransferase family domain-containing protein [Fusarium sporotrichioides]
MGSIEADVSTKLPTQDVFLFALNRTCSHVLCRLLSGQPGWTQSNYHFKRAFDFARESFNWDSIATVSDDQRRGFEKLLQEGFDEVQSERNLAVAENKSMFLKEHTFYIWEPSKLSQSMWGGPPSPPFTVQEKGSSSVSTELKTNPTIFPDQWLSQWRPIFLIRHPALTFESWYRAESGARHIDLEDRSWSFYTTYQYSRQLYDWFLSSGLSTSKLIVVDADDILENGPTIKNLRVSIGMDESKILYKWDTIQAPENAGRRELDFMSGYWGSTSVDSSKSSRGINLEAVYTRWDKDFNATVANQLRRIVEESMEDYNYLKGRKV